MKRQILLVGIGQTGCTVADVFCEKINTDAFSVSALAIDTDERRFSFKIKKGYIWNGADIPRVLWRAVGSRTDNDNLIASLVHDYMLECRWEIIEDVLKNSMNIKEYRRLTSLIFRQILKDTGTNTIKANIMSWAVQTWQVFGVGKQWKKK